MGRNRGKKNVQKMDEERGKESLFIYLATERGKKRGPYRNVGGWCSLLRDVGGECQNVSGKKKEGNIFLTVPN